MDYDRINRADLTLEGKLLLEVALGQLTTNRKLDTILEQIKDLMASQADLDAAIAQEGTDLTTLQTTVQSLITKLQSNPGGIDFTAEVTQLQAFDSAINTLNASAAAAGSGSSTTGTGTTGSPSGSSAPAASADVHRAKV